MPSKSIRQERIENVHRLLVGCCVVTFLLALLGLYIDSNGEDFSPVFALFSTPLILLVTPFVTACLYNKKICTEAFTVLSLMACAAVIAATFLSNIMTAAVIATVLTIIASVAVGAVAEPIRPGRSDLCPSCSYDLRANPTCGCPECGWGRD